MPSPWTRTLGLAVPIVCAPMGGVAGGALAGAVSRAGALGMIGMGSAGSRAALDRELAQLDAGSAPFGIGMVGWGIERHPDMFERALAAGPALVSVSFGAWDRAATEWIRVASEADSSTIAQVATVDEARRAADAGIDAVVARGREAGGHGDHRVPRDELLDGVLEAVDLPVLAAGGLHDAAGVEHVLSRGAAAAWVGTAFSACHEALTSAEAKAALFAATGEDTVVSRVMDIALERPWPEQFPERLVATPFVRDWQGRERELARDAAAKAAFQEAAARGDMSVVPVDAGLGVGHLLEARPAAAVVHDLAPRTR